MACRYNSFAVLFVNLFYSTGTFIPLKSVWEQSWGISKYSKILIDQAFKGQSPIPSNYLTFSIMPLPWETLLPFGLFDSSCRYFVNLTVLRAGLLTAMFTTAGTLMNISQRAQNDGKVCVLER